MTGIGPVVVRKPMLESDRDGAYWRAKSPEERIAAFVERRREFEGWTVETEPPLPRVVRVIRPQ